MGSKITLSLSDELTDKARKYCERNGIGSLQQGIRDLLTVSLREDAVPRETIDERMDSYERRLDSLIQELSAFREGQADIATETQERLIRTSSKGTKASLASLIALSTYLPPVGNLVDSTSHITKTALERLGFEIRDQGIGKDQATLLEWRERGPEAFFKFCWSAAGKASRRGAHVDYAELTKGLHEYPFLDDPIAGLPSVLVDLFADEQQLVENYGEDLANRWLDIREVKRSVEERVESGNVDGIEVQYVEQIDTEYRRILEELKERSRFSISRQTSRLVPDSEGPTFWREPTDDELDARRRRLAELGLSYPFSGSSTKDATDGQESDDTRDWRWFVDNLEEDERVEHLRYRFEHGYPMPDGYDGSLDEEIGE